MSGKPIGVVVNPASGKDVRRLVARASVFDNREKSAIVRRALIGAINAGATKFVYLDDSHNIARSALDELDEGCSATEVPCPKTASALDTIYGAEAMSKLDCAGVLILGGDGTSRAFAKGWRNATMLPLSTGTNNVFPGFAEATVAGAALGVLAAGKVTLEEVTRQVKMIDIDIDGEASDIALIDAAVTSDQFVGSRALLDGTVVRHVLLTRAIASAVGMTSVGGLLRPVSEEEDVGLHVTFGKGKHKLRAPIAPGYYQTLPIAAYDDISLGQSIEFTGPCMLAFDGERERAIAAGQKVTMTISRTGPRVLDINQTMQYAACRRVFFK